jgi:hypothetical protein
MVSAWPELPSAKPAGPSAGACDGQEALALNTSEPPPNWRLIDHNSGGLERSPVDRRGCGRKRRYRLMSTVARPLRPFKQTDAP